jgi:hypothetical protein
MRELFFAGNGEERSLGLRHLREQTPVFLSRGVDVDRLQNEPLHPGE